MPMDRLEEDSANGDSNGVERRSSTVQAKDFSDKITYAFQLATYQGPLCHEPMQGVAVFLEEVTVHIDETEESSAGANAGRLTGEVIKTVRESIRQGFLDWSPRIALAMYSCEIQASSKFSFPVIRKNH
jgi:ribosome assembly protein 1